VHKLSPDCSFNFVVALFGCGGGGGSASTNQYTMSGTAQKGPFVLGSTITVSELDSALGSNGTTYTTQTTDDLGHFNLSTKVKSNLVEIMGVGYYMNEMTGTLSTGTVTLRAIADLKVNTNPVLNVLTTIQQSRLKN